MTTVAASPVALSTETGLLAADSIDGGADVVMPSSEASSSDLHQSPVTTTSSQRGGGVSPEEAVPCSDNSDSELAAEVVLQKLEDGDRTRRGSYALVDSLSHSIGTGSSAVTGGEETVAILKHLLQRMQQQECAIQTLQETVQSQNTTLQTLTMTVQSGFAALMEKHQQQQHTEPPLKRLISPERDHPALVVANEGGTPESYKDCLRGDNIVKTTSSSSSKEAMPVRDIHCDDHSITISQLQQVHNLRPQTAKTTSKKAATERPALRVPHRQKLHQSDVSSLGWSHDHVDIMPLSKPWMVSAGKGGAQQTPKSLTKIPQPIVLGTKSSSLLLDEDSDDDETLTSHEREGFVLDISTSGRISALADTSGRTTALDCSQIDASGRTSTGFSPPPSPVRCTSCRVHVARDDTNLSKKNAARRDKMPSPPIYFPSPSVNRVSNRLSRATSAPLANFTRRRSAQPRLPPRLPSREEVSAAEEMDESSRSRGKIRRTLPPALAKASSPRCPTRLDDSTVLDLSGIEKLTKFERSVTSDTTSTASTMPRMPTRNGSVSEGLDATAMLGPESTGEEEEEDPLQDQNPERTMPRMPTRYCSMSEGLDVTVMLGPPATEGEKKNEEADPLRDSLDQKPESEHQSRSSSPVAAPSRVVSLDQQEHNESSSSTVAGTSSSGPTKQGAAGSYTTLNQSQSSLSFTRFKQLAATTSQQTNITSTSLSGDQAVVVGKIPPNRNNSRSSLLRASKREIFTKQGLAHLHVSCVTLDSALVDETHEWIGDDDDDDDDDDETLLTEAGETTTVDTSARTNDEDRRPTLMHVDSKEIIDATGETGRYTGTVSKADCLPTGSGTMYYSSGKYYKGEWLEGAWTNGLLLSTNGDSYNGDFVSSTRHGRGVYRYDNGDSYEGDFTADKPHGKGTFRFADGNVYSGGFIFGSFEGYGWYEFDAGRYEGEWKGGCYEGSGNLKFVDGTCYTGQFQGGKAHGRGEEVLEDGTCRRGRWHQGDLVEEDNN